MTAIKPPWESLSLPLQHLCARALSLSRSQINVNKNQVSSSLRVFLKLRRVYRFQTPIRRRRLNIVTRTTHVMRAATTPGSEEASLSHSSPRSAPRLAARRSPGTLSLCGHVITHSARPQISSANHLLQQLSCFCSLDLSSPRTKPQLGLCAARLSGKSSDSLALHSLLRLLRSPPSEAPAVLPCVPVPTAGTARPHLFSNFLPSNHTSASTSTSIFLGEGLLFKFLYLG